MRFVVDVMGNPAGSGGMNLYARELILAWAEAFPGDALVVVGGEWVKWAFSELPNISVCPIAGRSVFHRSWVQCVWAGVLARRANAEYLLSLSSMSSFIFPRKRIAVVVHDWRHLRRPEEFGVAQKLYRRLWQRSIARAELTIAISPKTHAETLRCARPRRLVMVRSGNDHPRRWRPATPNAPGQMLCVTYGHLASKRPEAVIEAIASLAQSGDFTSGKLVVLGARGKYRDRLIALALRLGAYEHVTFPGFVPDNDYQRMIQQADVVILNSSDEGYGLPVGEAAYFGTPVICARDSGLYEIHGTQVVLSEPTPTALEHAIRECLGKVSHAPSSVRSWSSTAQEIRRELCVDGRGGSSSKPDWLSS